jgi:hypothetical protein
MPRPKPVAHKFLNSPNNSTRLDFKIIILVSCMPFQFDLAVISSCVSSHPDGFGKWVERCVSVGLAEVGKRRDDMIGNLSPVIEAG